MGVNGDSGACFVREDQVRKHEFAVLGEDLNGAVVDVDLQAVSAVPGADGGGIDGGESIVEAGVAGGGPVEDEAALGGVDADSGSFRAAPSNDEAEFFGRPRRELGFDELNRARGGWERARFLCQMDGAVLNCRRLIGAYGFLDDVLD